MLSSGRLRFFSLSPLQRHNPKEFSGRQDALSVQAVMEEEFVCLSSWRMCFLFTPLHYTLLTYRYLLVGGLRIGSSSVGVSHAGARISLTLENPEILYYTPPPLANVRPIVNKDVNSGTGAHVIPDIQIQWLVFCVTTELELSLSCDQRSADAGRGYPVEHCCELQLVAF